MSEREFDLVSEAEDVIDGYIRHEITQAYVEIERLKKERTKDNPCGCHRCQTRDREIRNDFIIRKVEALNNWIDWLIDDPSTAEIYKCSVVRRKDGSFDILSGYNPKDEQE